jgi:DNA cross-link repair 1A protein
MLDWLRDLGLEKYARSFVKAEIDWESVVELDDEDLKKMGITALGPRKKLLATLEGMKSSLGLS